MTHQHIIILVLSSMITACSLLAPVRIESKEEMKSVSLGYPIKFVKQDLSRLDPPSFPQLYSFLSPWEFPFKISVWKAILNLLLVFGTVELVWLTYNKLRAHRLGRGTNPNMNSHETILCR